MLSGATQERDVPHDPIGWPDVPYVAGESKCGLCNEVWPCAERKRQRFMKREIINYLRSDLYERADLRPTDPPGIRFTSPTGWSVWLTYGVQGLPIAISRPDGTAYAAETYGTVSWLEEMLP